MSWQRTEIEGRDVWQREDGVTLPSWDAVEAFEKWEANSFETALKQVRQRQASEEETQEEENLEPLTRQDILFAIVLIAALLGVAWILNHLQLFS